MNALALALIVFGILLLGLGVRLARHRKATGIVVSLVGLGAMATPFIVTFILLR